MASNDDGNPQKVKSLLDEDQIVTRSAENYSPSNKDKGEKSTNDDDASVSREQKSPVQDQRLSREWDASQVPPSQFQRPKGSIYATPSTRDGHGVGGPDRDQRYWDKMKEKGWLPEKK